MEGELVKNCWLDQPLAIKLIRIHCMHRTHIRISTLAFMLMLHSAGAADSSTSAGSLVAVTPAEDTNAVLHNPDMGWVIYDDFPMDPDPQGSSTMLRLPGEEFPEADAVGIMFTWQDIEPRQDVYDFSKVDAAYDYWRQRGKTLQLRLSAASLIFWAKRHPPTGMGVPDYVLARMARREKQTRKMGNIDYVVVDARNAFYRERLRAFLHAVREHFDDRRPVNLIDLRGFGAWGEWHSGFRYPNLEARRAALKGILDIWSESLPRHMLALSYSYDPDEPKELYAGPFDRFDPAFTTNYAEFLHFSAFDYALTKTNITWRRDGCGGAVHSNERKLNEEAFRIFRRAPMFGEFLGGYASIKKAGSNWVSWVVDDALSLHPNYLNLIGWQGPDARDFARERPDLIVRGLRQMGYRLVPTRVQYPNVVTNGVPFEVRFDWVNRGMGRALRDYQIQFLLIGSDGAKVAESAPYLLGTSQWLQGTVYPAAHEVTFQNLSPGEYQLAFVLHDPVTRRTIVLPLPGGEEGRYEIGRVKVNPSQRFLQDRFAIGFWVDPPLDAEADLHYAAIAAANFTFLIGNFGASTPENVTRQLLLSAKYGLKAIVSMAGLSPEKLPDDKACWGYVLADEPGPGAFPELRRTVDALRKVRPGKLAYINLLPDYAPLWALGTTSYLAHVSRFISLVHPDVLSVDYYPHFRPDADGRDGYCQNLEVLRQQSLSAGIPFWNFFNAMPFGDHTDPTEAQLRWQIYTSLAYGAKGVMYFCYWTPTGDEFPKGGAIITREGKRTRHYDQAKRINAALKNLGPTLMKLTSTGVYRIHPKDDSATLLKGSPIRFLGEGDFLIGTFQDADGRRAVLLNNYHFAYSAWPTVVFDAPPASVMEVDPKTGEETPVVDDSPAMPGLQISLDAGEGRLFLLPAGAKEVVKPTKR